MANITDFVADIRTQVPDALESVIGAEVLKVVRMFCKRTTRWRVDLPDITLVLNQALYVVGGGASNLVLPADSEISLFVTAKQNGIPIGILRKQDIDQLEYCWQVQTGGQLRAIVPIDNTQIQTFPIPTDVTYPLDLRVVLIPTVGALTCPDFVFNDWEQAITAGTLGRLKNMVGQPWTDFNVAKLKQAEFDDLVADAAIQLDRGFSNRTRMAGVPRFGR